MSDSEDKTTNLLELATELCPEGLTLAPIMNDPIVQDRYYVSRGHFGVAPLVLDTVLGKYLILEQQIHPSKHSYGRPTLAVKFMQLLRQETGDVWTVFIHTKPIDMCIESGPCPLIYASQFFQFHTNYMNYPTCVTTYGIAFTANTRHHGCRWVNKIKFS